jgi:predicted protein tyrosine phosphatase
MNHNAPFLPREIRVMPRFIAERYNEIWKGKIPENIQIISVIDPECDPVFEPHERVLTLKFDDITHEYPERGRVLILFNESHACAIKDMLDKVGEGTLIVHCTAGICRSGAIGRFASEYLERDREQFENNHPHIMPNVHVLSLLRQLYKSVL